MRKNSVSEIKKSILLAEERNAKNDILPQRDGAKLTKIRQRTEQMGTEWMRTSGLNLAKLQAEHKKRETELERLVAKHKTDALRLAGRQKNKLAAEIAGQSKALHALASKADFFPHPSFSLATPFLIWATPSLQLDSTIAPFDSRAKFKLKTSASQGRQKVSFYFYWPNPFSDFAVINATTFMSASGHLKSHASWGATVNTAEVSAFARFGIWFGVQNDLNATDYVSHFLGRSGALSTWMTGGDTNGRSVSSGSSLSRSMFAVPPGNVAVFDVCLLLDYAIDGGDIEADFQSGDFKIACPVVVFSLLNSPPQ